MANLIIIKSTKFAIYFSIRGLKLYNIYHKNQFILSFTKSYHKVTPRIIIIPANNSQKVQITYSITELYYIYIYI